jgi:hypothetical protein
VLDAFTYTGENAPEILRRRARSGRARTGASTTPCNAKSPGQRGVLAISDANVRANERGHTTGKGN